MRMLLPLLLLACSEPEVIAPPSPPVPQQQSGTCPDLSESGLVTFESNGQERQAYVYLPSERGPGKPVLFQWYGVGDSGTNLSRLLRMEELADDEDAVVVVPQSLPENPLEWGFLNGGEHDLALYDDLRSCLYQDLQVDLSRFYSTGFSGGGLWTSFLTVHRSETLAAVLPFSGGTEPIIEYDSLEWEIPVLQSWGGPEDLWGIPGVFEVEFHATALAFEAELVADGHTVVRCEHDRGHRLPQAARDMIRTWLFPHSYGVASPFAEGALEGLPDYCERITE